MGDVVVVGVVGVSKRESQRCCRLVRKHGGAYGEKAIESGRGQHMTTMACRRWGDGSNCLRRGSQRNGLHDHLFDFRLVCGQYLRGYGVSAVCGHTSKASISNEAACFEGADRLCCADIRFIRSQTCWSVGALVTEARCSGNRVPGGSMPSSSASCFSSHEITSYQPAQELIRPPALGLSRPGNPAEVGVRLVYHRHTP